MILECSKGQGDTAWPVIQLCRINGLKEIHRVDKARSRRAVICGIALLRLSPVDGLNG